MGQSVDDFISDHLKVLTGPNLKLIFTLYFDGLHVSLAYAKPLVGRQHHSQNAATDWQWP